MGRLARSSDMHAMRRNYEHSSWALLGLAWSALDGLHSTPGDTAPHTASTQHLGGPLRIFRGPPHVFRGPPHSLTQPPQHLVGPPHSLTQPPHSLTQHLGGPPHSLHTASHSTSGASTQPPHSIHSTSGGTALQGTAAPSVTGCEEACIAPRLTAGAPGGMRVPSTTQVSLVARRALHNSAPMQQPPLTRLSMLLLGSMAQGAGCLQSRLGERLQLCCSDHTPVPTSLLPKHRSLSSTPCGKHMH